MAMMRSVWADSPDTAAWGRITVRIRRARIVPILESNLGPEMELAGSQLAVHLTVVGSIDDTPELGKVRLVEQVERLGADFNADVFTDADAFAGRLGRRQDCRE